MMHPNHAIGLQPIPIVLYYMMPHVRDYEFNKTYITINNTRDLGIEGLLPNSIHIPFPNNVVHPSMHQSQRCHVILADRL